MQIIFFTFVIYTTVLPFLYETQKTFLHCLVFQFYDTNRNVKESYFNSVWCATKKNANSFPALHYKPRSCCLRTQGML